jgi:hypothetical protein
MPEKVFSLGLSRRQFVTRIAPVCSLMCLGAKDILEAAPAKSSFPYQETKHKFDQEFGRKLTNRQFFNVRYQEFIQLAKALTGTMGKDKSIEFLKQYTRDKMMKFGRTQAERSPDNSFRTYVKNFTPLNYKDTLTMKVVEDTETAYELKVTECIWASTFLSAAAGEIGYASVCYGDYSWAEGFNPKIKLIRDKTLMEGHDYCNHRYVWEG